MDADSPRAHRPAEKLLTGGTMGGAVRVGDSVRRAAGPWSPTITRLLHHLRERGLKWVPEPLGSDDEGRDSLAYLPGVVPQYPLPDWVWDDAMLITAARLMADLHRAGRDFDRRDAVWQLPTHEPAEVICHNDFAPYNMAFTDGGLTGVIDWDTASPGPRVWDLAYLAYRLVPLTTGQAETSGSGSSMAERARRLRLLSDTYGTGVSPESIVTTAVTRLEELADFTVRRVEEGSTDLESHVDLYLRDARWIAAHAQELAGVPG